MSVLLRILQNAMLWPYTMILWHKCEYSCCVQPVFLCVISSRHIYTRIGICDDHKTGRCIIFSLCNCCFSVGLLDKSHLYGALHLAVCTHLCLG